MSPAPIPDVVALDSPNAVNPSLTGAKAANLADASARGLPVLPGFVVTTGATKGGELDTRAMVQLATAWRSIGGDDGATVVVRSSSTAEDTSSSSMAGQFTSVLGVRGWDGLLDAIGTVLASAVRHCEVGSAARPMAVLVQPQLDAVCGGVLFGLDPVTGDRRHIVVEAVAGAPDKLVSGTASAVHCLLGRRGRLVGGRCHRQRVLLPAHRRQRLAALARRAEAVFDAPQDLEWAVDASERLWLLQSRPVTAWGDSAVAAGPVLGPGPVAETFPDALRPLEVELWVEPLRDGVIGALGVTGAVGRRRIDSSPVVTTVGGRVAADLELFGISPRRRTAWQALNPVPAARRLLAAWRVGRLRAVLPALAADVVATIDADLTAIGDLSTLDDAELLELLTGAGHGLAALHAHEVLAGMLLEGGDRSSVGSIAVAALGAGRADGDLTDEELSRHALSCWLSSHRPSGEPASFRRRFRRNMATARLAVWPSLGPARRAQTAVPLGPGAHRPHRRSAGRTPGCGRCPRPCRRRSRRDARRAAARRRGRPPTGRRRRTSVDSGWAASPGRLPLDALRCTRRGAVRTPRSR